MKLGDSDIIAIEAGVLPDINGNPAGQVVRAAADECELHNVGLKGRAIDNIDKIEIRHKPAAA